MSKHLLKYDTNEWEEKIIKPVNTIQLFITNKCNRRCKECFYSHKLGNAEMSFEKYKYWIQKYISKIKKATILGGEPTMHKNLPDMIDFNNRVDLKTTIYTNGFDLSLLENVNLFNTSLRIGVHGTFSSEKPLIEVQKTSLPVIIVYMLTKANAVELMDAAKIAESQFDCRAFYISSIRNIAVTWDYWKDTPETLKLDDDYYKVVQNFVNTYDGNMEIHISTRGVIKTQKRIPLVNKCRLGNIFPDSEKIICPLDISKRMTVKELQFNQRRCNKNNECLLRKIVLVRKKN